MAVKHAIMINGVDGIIITKLDVLDDQKTINVCVGYQFGNKVYDVFPMDLAMRGECQPIYKELPGWQKETSGDTQRERYTLPGKKLFRRPGKALGREDGNAFRRP